MCVRVRLTVEKGSSQSGCSDCSSPGSYTLYTALGATPPPNGTVNRGTICYEEHKHTIRYGDAISFSSHLVINQSVGQIQTLT